jgi:hypothetical protein
VRGATLRAAPQVWVISVFSFEKINSFKILIFNPSLAPLFLLLYILQR